MGTSPDRRPWLAAIEAHSMQLGIAQPLTPGRIVADRVLNGEGYKMSQDELFYVVRGDWEIGMRMRFDVVIPVRSNDLGAYVDQPICYWPVRNERFPGVEFMMHASLRYIDEVTLAEKSTGATIAYGKNSDDLFETASERLASVTPEKMAQSIEKGMRQRKEKVVPSP